MATENNKEMTSAQLPLFYKKVVPLSKEVHNQLYIEPVDGYLHTKQTNSVYIAAVEFIRACHEYPIVFAKDNSESVFPVVLLGLEQNKNLFVNNKGEWLANYIPAYVRRYPFILATPDPKVDNFTVCIDESFSGFNTAKEGKPLFDEKGKQLDVLSQAVDFLKDYQSHVQLTKLFCDNLVKLDLLEPMQANIELAEGKKHTLSGFMGVNREKLKAIKPAKLAEMLKTDQLELIYAHLSSLANLNNLLKLASSAK